MAEKRISDLNNTTYANSTDYQVIVQNDETKKIKKIDLNEFGIGGSTPEHNQTLWYDTTHKEFYVYNENEWQQATETKFITPTSSSQYFNHEVVITKSDRIVNVHIQLTAKTDINVNYLSTLILCSNVPNPMNGVTTFTGSAITSTTKRPIKFVISQNKLYYQCESESPTIEIKNGAELIGNVTYICE